MLNDALRGWGAKRKAFTMLVNAHLARAREDFLVLEESE